MMKKQGGNQGIYLGSGNLNAANVAVGENAAIRVSGDVSVQIGAELSELRKLFDVGHLASPDVTDAKKAIDAIEEEAAKSKPDRSIISSALDTLERIGKAGSALLPMGEKLGPHLMKLAALLL
jgi:hypothetical protein